MTFPLVKCNENKQQWHQMSDEMFACDLNCNNNASASAEQDKDMEKMYDDSVNALQQLQESVGKYQKSITSPGVDPARNLCLEANFLQLHLQIAYKQVHESTDADTVKTSKEHIRGLSRLVREIEGELKTFKENINGGKKPEKAQKYVDKVLDDHMEIMGGVGLPAPSGSQLCCDGVPKA